MATQEQIVRVVIASDGKRGHENQSRVLARMLGDTEPLLMRLRSPEGGIAEKLLRARFALLGPKSLSQREAAALVRQHLKPESPDDFRDFAAEVGKQRNAYRVFTISTGTPPATMNLLLSRLLGAEPLCVMTPSLLPRRLFRLQVVPLHDLAERAAPPNVIVTPLALSYHDPLAAQYQAKQLAAEFGLSSEKFGKYWLAAIGGPSSSVQWDEHQFQREFTTLMEKAGTHRSLLITTSRRTPAATTEHARAKAATVTASFIDAATDERNPLPAFFELSELAAVTDDSFSMVCEAIQAGFRPYILKATKPNAKSAMRIENLARLGLLDNVAPRISSFVRGAPNVQFNQLREEVRARLALD